MSDMKKEGFPISEEELEQVAGGSGVDKDVYHRQVKTTTATKIYRVLPTPTSSGEEMIVLPASTKLLVSDEIVHCVTGYLDSKGRRYEYDYYKCAVRLSGFEYGYIRSGDFRDIF